MGAGLIDDFIRNILSEPFCPYHFVHTSLSNSILSVHYIVLFCHTNFCPLLFCPLPFCPRTAIVIINFVVSATSLLSSPSSSPSQNIRVPDYNETRISLGLVAVLDGSRTFPPDISPGHFPRRKMQITSLK